MGRIHTLPEALINKIAAGEVVERPASVVKELCENALDANARTIRVRLSAGGLGSVSVEDDGFGMSREDASAALGRHATSKLKDLDGLFHIVTMGFRGEALPAIASVSRFRLLTSEPNALSGTRLTTDGGDTVDIEDAPAAGGTRIDVEDLFFNTPARRKFMKRESTELLHCQEAVIRLALAHPEVAFFVEHEGRMLLSAPLAEADPKERIAAALGAEVHPHLLAVDEARLGVRVHGFVASPEFTLSNARGLYTLVNRRYIRDRGVNSAVQRAFQDSLPIGRQPVAVLFIELDPADVDVNVHPQKLEVRFSDGRAVQEALQAAISRALKAAPWRTRDDAVPTVLEGAFYAQAVDRFLTRAQESVPFLEAAPQGFGQGRPGINEAPPPGYFASLRYIGELAKRYWVCEAPGGTLLVLDPHAVRERLALHALTRGASTRQRTLFSAAVELPPQDVKRVGELSAAFERLGIEAEPFGSTTVAVKALPIGTTDAEALLTELLQVLPDESAALKILAHHAAMAPRSASPAEAQTQLAALDDADFEIACLHGKVVLHEVPLFQLAP